MNLLQIRGYTGTMETTKATAKRSPGPGVRGSALLAICGRADAAMSTALGSYQRDAFKAAADACLQASLRANKDGLREWAAEYGRKHSEMNAEACGG